ncbi:MFS transporter [Psychromicrobium lacuslunae]|uniref:Major facilitator superfamily (MFS) profile domain-containing protein n=1 Tax=Psychromicrobium lacuslunae TaxID=1618207 RepID=A0A0D4C1K9_9MICC|nr:MFS transporter [Psychromicrobium lacuslunae]AJT42542.1 hypothetical protein UM93_15530 [Psychromicrobium lacuslunae]
MAGSVKRSSSVASHRSRDNSNGLALALLAGTLFVFLSAEMLPVGLLPELSESFGVSPGSAGLLLSCYAVIAAIAGIPITNLTASWPRRRLLVIALSTLAISQLVFALSTTFWLALVSRAAAALLHTTVWAVLPVAASRLGGSTSGRAASYVFLGSALGLVLGTPAVAGLGQLLGWRLAAVLLAVLAALLAALLRIKLPALRSTQQPSDLDSPNRWLQQLLPRGLNPRVLLLCASTAVLVLGHYSAYSYFSVIFAEKGGPQTLWPLVLAIFGGAGLVGVFCAGRWIDEYRRKVSFTVLFGVPATLLILALSPLAGVYPATLGWGMAVAAVPLVMQSAVIRAAPGTADESSAAYVVAFQLGISGGSWLGGLLLSQTGSVGTLLIAAGLSSAAALILACNRQLLGPRSG